MFINNEKDVLPLKHANLTICLTILHNAIFSGTNLLRVLLIDCKKNFNYSHRNIKIRNVRCMKELYVLIK